MVQGSWGAVLRLGGRLTRNLSEMSVPAGPVPGRGGPDLYSPTGSAFPRVDSTSSVPWGLGRLFGATKGAGGPSGPPPHTRYSHGSTSYPYRRFAGLLDLLDWFFN